MALAGILPDTAAEVVAAAAWSSAAAATAPATGEPASHGCHFQPQLLLLLLLPGGLNARIRLRINQASNLLCQGCRLGHGQPSK